MVGTTLESIPTSLFLFLQTFLPRSAYIHLMNTSKDFSLIKFETIEYCLNLELTKEFFLDQDFQQKVLEKIKRPRQLVLWYTFCSKTMNDFSTILTLRFSVDHHLQCASESMIPRGNVRNLCDEFYRLKSCCSILQMLPTISRAHRIELAFCQNIVDLSCMKNCLEVKLVNCPRITNVSCLNKANCVSLINCSKISDVSKLGNVYNLTLLNCPEVADISGLTNNTYLAIGGCPKIADYSAIAGVKYLALYDPNIPNELPDFKNVRKLSLSSFERFEKRLLSIPSSVSEVKLHYCRLVPDPHFLSHLQSVEISNCYDITQVRSLGNVASLKLVSCFRLHSLEGLGSNREVVVEECIEIEDFSPLNSIPSVSILNCPGFVNGNDVRDCQHLTIENSKIDDVSMFCHLRSLKLMLCDEVSSLIGLSHVPVLLFDSCRNIRDVSPLTNNQKLVFQGSSASIRNLDILRGHYIAEDLTDSIAFVRRQN